MSYLRRGNEFVILKPFEASLKIHASTGDEVLVKQSFKDECDINLILAKYQTSGFIDHYSDRECFFGDVSNVPSYQEALRIVREAEDAFMSLPGEVRARFLNDPAEIISFVEDDNNREEAIKLGLIRPPEESDVGLPHPDNSGGDKGS